MFWSVLLATTAAATVSASNHRKNIGSDRILRLHADGPVDVTEAIGEMDVWGRHPSGGVEVRVPASGAHFDLLAAKNINITDVTEEHMSHFDWFFANNQTCYGGKECLDNFYDTYQTRANINAYVDDLTKAHPDLIDAYQWGTTYEGNTQEGVHMCSHDNKAKKAAGKKGSEAIFYFCGEHAREWLPPMFCVYMIEQLATQYGTDPEVTRILDNFDVYILPVMNPDGYDYSHTSNNMWRKNRQPNTGSSCDGTDLNRNYLKEFGGPGSSNNPCSETYRGPTAFSAPETTNLQSFADRVDEVLVVQTDVHAYGQMWMHPWGYTYALPDDEPDMKRSGDATVAAIQGVNGLRFASGSIANVIYLASGSSCDHFYANHGVKYAYAPEVRGSSFQPPASNIGPSNAELWAGFLAQAANIQ